MFVCPGKGGKFDVKLVYSEFVVCKLRSGLICHCHATVRSGFSHEFLLCFLCVFDCHGHGLFVQFEVEC